MLGLDIPQDVHQLLTWLYSEGGQSSAVFDGPEVEWAARAGLIEVVRHGIADDLLVLTPAGYRLCVTPASLASHQRLHAVP